MIASIPNHILGIDYHGLSPKEGHNLWRWVGITQTTIEFDYEVTPDIIEFKDHLGKTWLRLEGKIGIISPDYAWNGCSPKRHIPLFGWVGTPDHKRTRLASKWHDVLCQMIYTEHMPFNRKQIDAVFYDILNLSKYRFKGLFHGTVKALSPIYPITPHDVYSVKYPKSPLIKPIISKTWHRPPIT